MANNYTSYAKNFMLDQVPSILYISVHSADPTDVGSNEVIGVTRAEINLDPAANGIRDAIEEFVDLTIPAGSEITHVGIFDAASAGNFIAYAPVLDSQGQPTTITFTQELPFRVTEISLDLNNA